MLPMGGVASMSKLANRKGGGLAGEEDALWAEQGLVQRKSSQRIRFIPSGESS
jgi:hypothetical protein